MRARLKIIGLTMVAAGFVFIGAGTYTYLKAEDGAGSLQAFSAAQDVKLGYNDQGQLTDRGDTAVAAKILTLLTDDWGYAINRADLDPNDPLVDTATEYMYQMATISYHVLNSEQKVALTDHADYKDQHFDPGEYNFAVAGRYWSQFDRANPVEAKARELAWTGTAQALIAALGVGSVTATAIQMGFGIAVIVGLLGAAFVLLGGGLYWAARPTS